MPDFKAFSAGTHAVIGHPMHHEAALVLEKLGGVASNFSARQLTPRMATEADLVLAMTKAHRDLVLERAPRLLRRTFTLSEAARLVAEFDPRDVAELGALRPQLATHGLRDIPDPINHEPAVFAAVGSQIAGLLPPILQFCLRVSEPCAE